MPTRGFVLEAGAERRFWDISWDGPMVEITSGRWGTNGRARETRFESSVERDAFIEREIAKALKKGFLEIGHVAPAGELSRGQEERARKLLARLASQRRPAFRPVLDPHVSRFGSVSGAMSLDRDESWPSCPSCHAPLAPLIELDLREAPTESLRRNALAQLFSCEVRDNGGGGVQCWRDGFDGYLARWHRPSPRRIDPPLTSTRPSPVGIADWIAYDELPPLELVDRATRDAIETGSDAFVQAIFEEIRAASNRSGDDGYDVYRDVTVALAAEPKKENKLGGWPLFVQECTVPWTEQLFQFEHEPRWEFGDVGAGHLLIDGRAGLRFFWSCH